MADLSAGRELDALIAERVFGWTRVSTFSPRAGTTLNHGFPPTGHHPLGAVPPSYSTDIAAAWQIAANAVAEGRMLSLNYLPEAKCWNCRIYPADYSSIGDDSDGATAPEALCLAALAFHDARRAAHPGATP